MAPSNEEACGDAAKTLTARCFCKAVNFTVTIRTSDLPLPVHLCSCTICRRTHGTLSTFHAPLPKGVFPQFEPPSALETALTGYIHADGAKSERFFCRTCGCHIGDRDLEPDSDDHLEWRVASSIFEEHTPELFRIQTHVYAGPSQGAGGMREWLPTMGDVEMRVWNPPEEEHPSQDSEAPKQEFDEDGNEVLRAECHCGGVSFTIPRPTAPATAQDPYLKWWASPLDASKWAGTLDLCNDCRLMDGAHVVGWTFVPLAQTRPRVPADFRFGTLTAYESTPDDVRRAFCGVCGATVFFSCKSRNPTPERQIVDVAVGILRPPEGLAAEKWLLWRTGRISYFDSGKRYDPVFAESLHKGYEDWGTKMYGQSPDFKLGPPA